MAVNNLENEELVVLSRSGHVAVVTLNRPGALNSLNKDMCVTLHGILDEIELDDSIRAVIVTGSGEKAFCAGMDLRERNGMSAEEVNVLRQVVFFPLFRRLEDMKKPLIAAINGLCLGGGAEMVLICDIRIAAETASFGQTEVKWGITPGGGACQRLPAIVGVGMAKELLLTGRTVNAEEGEKIGLFNRVTTLEGLMEAAMEMAEMIAENAPVAVRQIKKGVNLGYENYLALAFDREASEVCYHTQDRLEGIAAFGEKRKPKFIGR